MKKKPDNRKKIKPIDAPVTQDEVLDVYKEAFGNDINVRFISDERSEMYKPEIREILDILKIGWAFISDKATLSMLNVAEDDIEIIRQKLGLHVETSDRLWSIGQRMREARGK